VPHPDEHSPANAPLAAQQAEQLAERMSAFTAGSRLRILYVLLEGERAVEEIAAATGLPASLVSQQLRVLRHLRTVDFRRDGRRAIYRLFDDHVADLLRAMRYHAEHEHYDGGPGGVSEASDATLIENQGLHIP
jgi:DNA-binding transcriptional ArsR family regulator